MTTSAQIVKGGGIETTIYAIVDPWNERVIDNIQTAQNITKYTKRLLFGNESQFSITFYEPTIRGVDAAAFEIVDFGNTGGFPLAVNASVRDKYITVAFKPAEMSNRAAERNNYSAELAFTTNSADPKDSEVKTQLMGVAWQPQVKGSNVDFGVLSTWDAPKTVQIRIANNHYQDVTNPTDLTTKGTHAVHVTDIRVVGPNVAQVVFLSTPTPANPWIIAPGESRTIDARFSPAAAGTGQFSVQFEIISNSGTTGAAPYTPVYTVSATVVGNATTPGLRVVGRDLYTPCDDVVLLRGVNKMAVWTQDLELRKKTYEEIRKTGANCVRIVWLAQPSPAEVDAGVDGLDRTIQDCIDNDMIPIIEMHDATGQWAKLQMVLDYWKRPDVIAVIKKHEKYLIINIANECGEYEVTDEMFKAGYESALTQLRTAGIHTPLVIDAADWGKNLAQLVRVGPYLMSKDPDKNVMFSVHTYWDKADGGDANFITTQFQAAVDAGMPLMVGEFAGLFNRGGACTYEADHETIIQRAQEMGLGYLAWEWGPGNEFAHPTCTVMNMTTDSHFNTLQIGWAREVALSSANSIKNTSVTPQYIVNAGVCLPTSVDDDAADVVDASEVVDASDAVDAASTMNMTIAPNPFSESAQVSVFTKQDGRLRITMVNVLGEVVALLFDEHVGRGHHYATITNAATHSNANETLFCCVELNGRRMLRPVRHVR